MPRIGFAYNQKPESPTTQRPDDEAVRGDDEPPSRRRDAIASRNSDAPASTEIAHSVTVGGSFATPAHSAGSNGSRSHSSASNGHHANGAASNGHPPSDASSNGAPANTAAADDEFAEWDSADTVDAVANALSALGDVIRLVERRNHHVNARRCVHDAGSNSIRFVCRSVAARQSDSNSDIFNSIQYSYIAIIMQ